MKKKKILISAFLTIALCLSLVCGATFAIFTDNAKVDVSITSGKVDVNATVEGLTTYSRGLKQETGKFANGGTATTENSEVVLTNVTPGDKVEFTIDVANESNIIVQYRTIISATEDNGLLSGLVIKIGENTYGGYAQSDWTTLAPEAKPEAVAVSIELPYEAGNEYMNKTAKLSYRIEVVQGNADVFNGLEEENGVYLIKSANDLQLFASMVNSGTSFNGKTVRLENDIDLSNVLWAPIKSWNTDTYTIDGNGKTISNLTLNGAGYLGFFSSVSSNVTIKNLTFENAQITSSGSFVGTVIGYQYGNVTLDNVKVNDSSVQSTAEKGIRVGGLVGASFQNDGASLTLNNCEVMNTTITAYHNVGAFVGSTAAATGEKFNVNGCKSNATVVYTATAGIGGHAIAAGANGYADAVYTGSNNNVSGVSLIHPIVDGFTLVDGVYEVSNANGLFYFAESVNSGKYKSATVKLVADIDLENKAWTPIGQTGTSYGATAYFMGTFDGNGKTISNLSITAAYDGEHYATGLFGFIDMGDATIKNLTVDSATVKGHHWTGVIVGYLTGKVTNCTVTNATVECTHANDDACGDKAGVIVGYVNKGIVTGNTVKKSTVSAGRDAGQVAGAAKAEYVYNNNVSNVTVTATGDCTGANVRNEAIGRLLSEIVTVSDAEGLKADVSGYTSLTDDVAITSAVKVAGGVLDGNGNTVDTSSAGSSYDCAVTVTKGGKVINATIKGNAGYTRAIGSGSSGTYTLTEDLIVDNVTVDSVLYAINGGGDGNSSVYVTNSTINGWCSYSNIELFSFENCKLATGNSYLGYMVVYGDTEFTDCTFEDFWMCARTDAAGKTVTFTDCKYVTEKGEEKVTAENFKTLFCDEGDYEDFNKFSDCKVIIDGVEVSWN